MEYNKVYFNIIMEPLPPNQNVTTSGLVIRDFNFRQLLGNLFDQYNVFSFKVESFSCRHNNATAPINDFFCFHIAGLNFVNGFDTATEYSYSRVLEIVDFSLSASNNPFNFISNCNSTMFYKPTSDILDLTFFYTRFDNTFSLPPDSAFYIFSITGVDAYKKHNPQRSLTVPRMANRYSINFTLNTRNAEVIDTRRRAFRFNNVNLRNLIGNIYDKYDKFILIVESIAFSTSNGTNFMGGGNNFYFCVYLSGFPFITIGRPQYFTPNSTLDTIHTSTPTPIASGNFGNTNFQQTLYNENAFYKSSENINIVLSYNWIFNYVLNPVNTGNAELFPHMSVNFDIVPIVD